MTITIIDKKLMENQKTYDLWKSMTRWDKRFLNLAEHIAQWSKDPSTKVGAVIADKDNRIVSLGYNGFPKGVNDDKDRYDDREQKYSLVVHAEINAILFAQKGLKNATLYTWPMAPCERCAGFIIQSGLETVVSIGKELDIRDSVTERWAKNLNTANMMFEESNLDMRLYEESVWQEL